MNNLILIGGGVVALIVIIFLSNTLLRPGNGPERPGVATPIENTEADPMLPEAPPTLEGLQTAEVATDTPAELTTNETSAATDTLPPPPLPPPSFEDTAPTDSTTPPTVLPGTSWRWKETTGPAAVTPEVDMFVINFSGGGSMDSSTDCNRLGGPYRTTGTTLTFSDMFSTQMFCEGSQEQVYRDQLSQVGSFKIESDTLYLYLTNDGGTMRFEAD